MCFSIAAGLLLSGATTQNKQVFNILCEQPETVSRQWDGFKCSRPYGLP